MVAKTEVEVANKMDTVKLLLAIVLLLAGIAGFYYFEAEGLIYRVLGLLAFVVVALGLVYTTHLGQSIVGFGRAARGEVRKVVWPTRQETIQTTMMVIVAVIILGIFLWFIDMMLVSAVQYLTGQGG
ncbi:MAG: preprotein translocase subunit SecE [Gammaproteobacteria bacterium]|jgi:preprotein translocase subunit SecE|nr:preprotein translocase subunit SecE [Gammaproteobacteria bacterium]